MDDMTQSNNGIGLVRNQECLLNRRTALKRGAHRGSQISVCAQEDSRKCDHNDQDRACAIARNNPADSTSFT